MKLQLLLFSFFLLIENGLKAQEIPKNSSAEPISTQAVSKKKPNGIYSLTITGNTDLPAFDMAKRFGNSYRLGLELNYKTEKNYVFGVKGELLMGNAIKEDSLLYNARTSQGGVITQLGEVLNVGTFERGYMIGLQAGKIFPLNQKNLNAGITTLFSAGFMQHKIKLFDQDNSFPQLRNGYDKGYDRLSNGLYVENFTGYTHHAKNKLINFYAGLNVVWGFTKGRRDYLFDVARADDANRNDVLLGFKFGWILPIYKKITEDTYY